MANPKIAIDAILADQEKQVKDYKLYPITLGRYALLELIGSPLVDTNAKFTMINVIPTLYICLNDIQTLKKYSSVNVEQLKSDAMAWSEDSLATADVPALVDTILKELLNVNKAAPVSSDNPEKKQQATDE